MMFNYLGVFIHGLDHSAWGLWEDWCRLTCAVEVQIGFSSSVPSWPDSALHSCPGTTRSPFRAVSTVSWSALSSGAVLELWGPCTWTRGWMPFPHTRLPVQPDSRAGKRFQQAGKPAEPRRETKPAQVKGDAEPARLCFIALSLGQQVPAGKDWELVLLKRSHWASELLRSFT